MLPDLHEKYPPFLSDFHETVIFSTDLKKNTVIKFHENPSSGRRVIPCGPAEGRPDMTKLDVAYRSLPNVPNNQYYY